MSGVNPTKEYNVRSKARRRNGRRLLWLLLGIGLLAILSAGIYRARFITLPSLMDNAAWIAPFDKYNNYRWDSNQEMTLYAYRQDGLAVFRWNVATRQATLLEVKKHTYPGEIEKRPQLTVSTTKNEVTTIRTWFKYPFSNPTALVGGVNMPRPDYTWKLRVMEGVIPVFHSYAASPDGKYVAYITRMQRPDPVGKLLRRFKFMHLPQPKEGIGIMVNDAEGKNARLLGFTEVDMPEPHTKYSKSGKTASLQHLEWRPDGKQLSFEYGDGIYALPVNQ